MTDHRACQSALRSPLLFLSLALAAAALSVGCDTTVRCAADCGGAGGGGGAGGSASCTSTKGTISGTVYRWSAPGNPDSEIAAGANIDFLLSPGGPDATLLHGQADQDGHYSVEIDAGTWILGGDDGGGCINTESVTVTLDPCGTEQADVVLDICSG